jgi:hypothetical protein
MQTGQILSLGHGLASCARAATQTNEMIIVVPRALVPRALV